MKFFIFLFATVGMLAAIAAGPFSSLGFPLFPPTVLLAVALVFYVIVFVLYSLLFEKLEKTQGMVVTFEKLEDGTYIIFKHVEDVDIIILKDGFGNYYTIESMRPLADWPTGQAFRKNKDQAIKF